MVNFIAALIGAGFEFLATAGIVYALTAYSHKDFSWLSALVLYAIVIYLRLMFRSNKGGDNK